MVGAPVCWLFVGENDSYLSSNMASLMVRNGRILFVWRRFNVKNPLQTFVSLHPQSAPRSIICSSSSFSFFSSAVVVFLLLLCRLLPPPPLKHAPGARSNGLQPLSRLLLRPLVLPRPPPPPPPRRPSSRRPLPRPPRPRPRLLVLLLLLQHLLLLLLIRSLFSSSSSSSPSSAEQTGTPVASRSDGLQPLLVGAPDPDHVRRLNDRGGGLQVIEVR